MLAIGFLIVVKAISLYYNSSIVLDPIGLIYIIGGP